MYLASLDAEDITGQIERDDLAPAVVEHPIGPYRTGQHLVEIFGGLVFAIDLGVAGKAHRCTHHGERAIGLTGANRHRLAGEQRRAGRGEHGRTPTSNVSWPQLCSVSEDFEIRVV